MRAHAMVRIRRKLAAALATASAAIACGDSAGPPRAVVRFDSAAPLVLDVGAARRAPFTSTVGLEAVTCTSAAPESFSAARDGGACSIVGVAPGAGYVIAGIATTVRDSVRVTIAALPDALRGLTLASPFNLAVGQSLRLTPVADPASGAVRVAYRFASNNSAVATVDSTGTVSALTPGIASIDVIATARGDGLTSNTITRTAVVTVSPVRGPAGSP